MAEDSSRRKSNNPSRVLQTTETGEEDQHNQEFNESDIIDIPDDDGGDGVLDSKEWYQTNPGAGGREEEETEDGGRGFVFSTGEVNDNVVVLTSDMELQGTMEESLENEIQGRRAAHSILHGSRSLKPRKQVGSSFNRPRQFMGVSYDGDQVYPADADNSQVRRQQRAVEPFVCRTTSSSGKKDASMQFPDDELTVLREENDALRKENSELRKKVDRLVETIALNDALPNLLASLRGAPANGDASQHLSTSTDNSPPEEEDAVPSTSASPQAITISRCQSLANDEPSSGPPTSTHDAVIPVSDMGVVGGQVVTTVSSQAVSLPHIPLSQVSLPQLAAAMDHDMLPHHLQQQVHIPRAPVLPVLASSIQMGVMGQPPMVPPGAPSQLAMMQQSLSNPVPQSAAQTVLQHVSHMTGGSVAPVRIRDRGKLIVRPGGKQTEDSVEISLSNNVKVDKRLLDRCNHTNFRKLTSDLLMCLFPRKVLSRSTLGGTSNTISRTTGLPTNKTRLDPEKVEAILDYVQRVTGVPARAVKDAIRTKLNNEAKRMHRQLIFKRSIHYPSSTPGGPTGGPT